MPPGGDARPKLLLSVDFEDWHQLVRRKLGFLDWEQPGPALESQTTAILDLLDELGVQATFFMLGMTVANHPELAREIAKRGHEPACHGYAHERVHRQSRDEFARDVERCVELLDDTCGRRPVAYRAPAFSINRDTPWAYDVLGDLGFRCDSSQHDSPRVPRRLGGIPSQPYRLSLASGRELWELPVAVWRAGRVSLPIGGGSYWRLLPQSLLLRGLHDVASKSPAPVLYLHPYECDPRRLRIAVPPSAPRTQRARATLRAAWRNTGRNRVVELLRAVAREFRLVSYESVYDELEERGPSRPRALSPEGVVV
jgi:polysaccharide deacetylase family protein (PEP-CTERM system associated)